MKRYFGMKIFAVIGFVTMAVLGAGLLVMFLWNGLMPEIFGLPTITFVQAIGLLLLSRILFGGFSGKSRGKHPRHHWKNKMKQKWGKMTPEEKVAFKQKMKHWRRKGCWPEEGEAAIDGEAKKDSTEEDFV